MKLSTLAATASILALVSLSCAALAQAPAPAPAEEGGKPRDPAARAARLEERFKAADKDGDGKLTKDEAEAGGLRRVAEHFDEIDKDHKGYVTLDEIKAALAARRGAR